MEVGTYFFPILEYLLKSKLINNKPLGEATKYTTNGVPLTLRTGSTVPYYFLRSPLGESSDLFHGYLEPSVTGDGPKIDLFKSSSLRFS